LEKQAARQVPSTQASPPKQSRLSKQRWDSKHTPCSHTHPGRQSKSPWQLSGATGAGSGGATGSAQPPASEKSSFGAQPKGFTGGQAVNVSASGAVRPQRVSVFIVGVLAAPRFVGGGVNPRSHPPRRPFTP
jgi:hypothetical protein